jgi:hypothetical protein
MEPVTVQLALGYAAGNAIHLAHPGAAGTVTVSCARLTSWPTFLQMCCAQVPGARRARPLRLPSYA